MNLAVFLLLQSEPFDLEGLIGQLVRFGLLAVLFLGPLLKKVLGGKKETPTARRRTQRPVGQPRVVEPELEELEDAWTVLPQVEPAVNPASGPAWIDLPTAMPTRLPEGDLMHASFDEHHVPLDLPEKELRGVRRGWRSAILMREVLAPPVGLRSPNADRAPFG